MRPLEKRQEVGDPRYLNSMASRAPEYSNYPRYPHSMPTKDQSLQYARHGYGQPSREHLNGSKGHYMAQEYPPARSKLVGMNGNPNRAPNSLNRENSGSYIHHSHHMGNSNPSPALDLANGPGAGLRNSRYEGTYNPSRERDQSGMRGSMHG